MGCGASSPAGGLSEAAVAVAGPSVAITVKSVPDGENRGTRYVVRHVQSDCIAHYQIGKWEADADLAVLAQLTDPDEPGKTLGAKDVPSLAEIAYETSGERLVQLAPGLLLEAPNYALELVVLLPVDEVARRRPEHEFGIIAGVRLFF